MKIVPFPSGGEAGADPAVIAELEAALAGAEGPGARAWRELSGDIRSLAPPIDADFENTLERRLGLAPADLAGPDGPEPAPAPARSARRRWPRRRLGLRPLALGGAGALTALVIAVLLAGPFPGPSAKGPAGASFSHGAPTVQRSAPPSAAGDLAGAPALSPGTAAPPAGAPAVSAGPAAPSAGPDSSAGRVQQRAASLTLVGAPAEVQRLADGVSRVVRAEGGIVTSSQVQVEAEGQSDATLQLSVPSARLTATLAALGRLGAVRAETQSLQDITGAYDAARRALGDAIAERSALLRALAAATTQGEIESLHRRLAIAGGTIERARSAFGAISSRAANSTIEVTVAGDAKAAQHGLTLAHGLHDAGRVLTVSLVILLIALAVLLPLAGVASLLWLAARALRRAARERALGPG